MSPPEAESPRAERVTIPTADGPMEAYVARPAAPGANPAMVVVQEAFGVNGYIRDVCLRFAGEGYVAIAPELFHRSGSGIEIPYGDLPPAMAQIGILTNDGIEGDLAAAFAYARTDEEVDAWRVGLVGFCVGGFAAFLGACRLDPAATVSFYGGGIVRPRPGMRMEPVLEEAAAIDAPLLCLFGAEDGGIPPPDVAAIREGLEARAIGAEVVVYEGAKHGFFCDQRPAYHAEAAAAAWQRTLDWCARYVRGAARS
ncbi:MAG: dienelactone hydrolase family protein [Candidatus Eisenbacteria bacterium]